MQGRAILVVDDDPFVCRLISHSLESEGGRLTAVGDPQKALELFAARSFDLVVTDYAMPVMTGAELARRMKTLKPSIPICLVTASTGDVDSSELEEFSGVLEKPFEKPDLTALVASALTSQDRKPKHVARPQRFEADWRVDLIPLESGTLVRTDVAPRPAVLRNLSEHGLAVMGDTTIAADRFCAFLIYPPLNGDPSLMVGEIRWTTDQAGGRLSGARTLFWGSEGEKRNVIEQAM